MSKYILVNKFKNIDKYDDKNKDIKNILTDFINDNFLKYEINQNRLLKLIYSKINPIINRYGLVLIFKGGNVFNLINKNVKKYLPPKSDKIIMDIFEPYLKKSDNDFTILINPNLKNYDYIINKISEEILLSLDEIKLSIMENIDYYFDIFKLNKNKYNQLFLKLERALNVKNIKLKSTYNKKIILKNQKNNKSDILVYEDKNSLYSFIFNSINKTLEFKDSNNRTIKFYLLRSKINFLIDNKINIAGELIDISLPYKNDYEMLKLNTTKKFNNYMKKNIINLRNKNYGFNYSIINLGYIVKDLYKILYETFNLPWDNLKYNKRLARLIYFIFINDLNKSKISSNNLKKISDQFKLFIYEVNLISINKSYLKNENLKDIIYTNISILKKIINDDKEKNNFIEYIILLNKYSKSILKIIDNLNNYLIGNENINKKILYQLNNFFKSN